MESNNPPKVGVGHQSYQKLIGAEVVDLIDAKLERCGEIEIDRERTGSETLVPDHLYEAIKFRDENILAWNIKYTPV